jgi:5'-3' exonuclease
LKVLIDSDIVTFSCAAYNEPWGWDACREDIDNLMKRIIESTESDSYLAILTGDDTYRYEIDPNYKANRKDKPRPIYLEDARAHLVTAWGAVLTDRIEADDRLGIEQCQSEFGSTCIASIDKDLKQIPGYHFNWRKNERILVSPLDGLRCFYRQLLTGDTTDNVPGVGGIGKVKSAKLIDNLTDEVDMFQVCQALYDSEERLLRNGQLLYIHQRENDDWAIHYKNLLEQVAKLSSQILLKESNDPTSDTI